MKCLQADCSEAEDEFAQRLIWAYRLQAERSSACLIKSSA
jgi:hypothetical protein